MWVQKAHFDFNCLLWFSAGVTEQGSTVQFLKLWCRLGTAGKFSGNLQNARETGQRGVPDIFQMTLHRTLLLTAFERRFQWLQTKIQRRGRYYEHGRETHLVGGVGNEVKGKEKCGRIKKNDKWQFYHQQVSLESSHKKSKTPRWSGGFSKIKKRENTLLTWILNFTYETRTRQSLYQNATYRWIFG